MTKNSHPMLLYLTCKALLKTSRQYVYNAVLIVKTKNKPQ